MDQSKENLLLFSSVDKLKVFGKNKN